MILLDTHIWLRWLLHTEPLPIRRVNLKLMSPDSVFPVYQELAERLIA